MNKIAILTISSHNYMPYGLNCLYSAKEANPNFDYYYFIADKYQEDLYQKYSKDIEFVSSEQLSLSEDEILNMAFKYNIVEFNTCIKPSALDFVLKKGYDTVIYLDPDIECYSSFDSVINKYKDKSIIVTPHKMSDRESSLIKDRAFLNNGIYNLGFLMVNNTKETRRFLNWWNEKLKNECFLDYVEGLATDQIWVELASTIFEGFDICKNEGVNVAFWNLHERNLNKKAEKYYVNESLLVFFHFSSLSINCKQRLLKELEKMNGGFLDFYNSHIEKVKSYDYDILSKEKYEYSIYSNGDRIENEERWLYGYSNYLSQRFRNPFNCSEKDSFYKTINSRKLTKLMKPKDRIDSIILFMCKVTGVRKCVEKGKVRSVSKRAAKMIGRRK